MTLLEQVPVGSRIRVAGRTAVLLKINPCRALVRYEQDAERVRIGDAEFDRPGTPVSIAPRSEVEVLGGAA